MQRFYPSCNFQKIDPIAYDKLNAYAMSRSLEIAPCCRRDDAEGKADDLGYYICQACRPVIESHQFPTESLWKLLAEDDMFAFPDYSSLELMVIDCWRDKDHPEIGRYVRKVLEKMNIRILEPETQFDFCGRFHLETKLYKEELERALALHPEIRFLDRLPDGLYERILAEKAASLQGSRPLVYCNTCFNSLHQGGGSPLHIASLVMQSAVI